ncbi:unnamed protein product [Eruca vesicaria subsp. sativa]|uniref:Eisosome protein SEG2 n=1 Tax=Eruca vesicaria subsp. sativa TaxID=29727 RepID=A0ABC8JLP1_ERUVS|nr:unnamed protein product [Eruca vesicaria subsp. sativa]
MGCFPGCFGGRKNRRRQRRREEPRLNKISECSTKEVHLKLSVPIVEEVQKSAKDVNVSKISEGSAKGNDHQIVRVPAAVEEVTKVSVIPTTDICDKEAEERNSPSPTRKRVTFDSKVKTYEHIAVDESVELLEEEEKKKEEVKLLKSSQAPCSSEGSDVTSNSSSSFPSNHRYQNCRESDDEEEEDAVTDCDESDLEDDDDDDGGLLDDDYYDDNYDDKRPNYWDNNNVYTEEIADNVLNKDKSNTSARDRTGYVNAVLNPIENLSQWKAVKSKGRTMQTESRKENTTLISDQEHKLNASFNLEEPRVDEELLPSFSIKQKSRDEIKKQRSQEVPAVDASLSTWLSTSQTTNSGCSSVSMGVKTVMSEKKYCSKPVQSYDERPILGALTSEEIKQFSATNSPRKSPSRSPESPIIGTVGGYWNNHSMATRK